MKRTIKIQAADEYSSVKIVAVIETSANQRNTNAYKEDLTNRLHKALRGSFNISSIKILK